MSAKEAEDGTWFGNLLMEFAPDTVSIDGKTPEEMIQKASWSAFTVSTLSALPPGPIGWLTILPEIIAVTKIQINLIYKIAEYYNKRPVINSTMVMLIFANEAGVNIGKKVLTRVGRKVIIRALGSKAIRPIAQKIGARIGTKITSRLVGRWIPVIIAPIFGAFSKSMTTKIGEEAIALFQEDIEIAASKTCSNGHDFDASSKFCPECGEPQPA